MKKFTRILPIIFSILLTCTGVELVSRFYLNNMADPYRFNTYASINQLRDRYGAGLLDATGQSAYMPHRYIGYVPRPDYINGDTSHNSAGYRGEEIIVPKSDDVFRIVALGGSTTYSQVADNAVAYPYLLQEQLRDAGYSQVEVINAGANSYTSLESLINLEIRVLDLQPDMILVYHGINDVHPRLVYPSSAYKRDYSGARIVQLQSVRMPSLLEYSTALRMGMIFTGLTQTHSNLDWSLIGRPGTFYADELTRQQNAGTYPQGIFEDISAMDMLQQHPPIYFEDNLHHMVNIARLHEIEPVLMTFAYSPLFKDFPRVSSEEYRFALDEQNEVVRQLADVLDVALYDLAETMPDNMDYYTDGRHFTAEGNAFRAELIAEFLIEQNLLPDASPD